MPMYSNCARILLNEIISSKPFTLHISSLPLHHRHHHHNNRKPPRLLIPPLRSTGDNQNSSTGRDENITPSQPAPQSPANVTPAEGTVEIKLRRGSRRRLQRRRLDQEALWSDELARMKMKEKEEEKKKAAAAAAKEASSQGSKIWKEMTLTEKALELYLGEKGLLFWLNKFAYASIFIIIGGWILFRFVGPALNLYQLESPPLSPTTVFKER